MRRLALVLLSLAACGSSRAAPTPTAVAPAGPTWDDVVALAGGPARADACAGPAYDPAATLQVFGEQQAALKRAPDDPAVLRAVHAAGSRLQHEGVALVDVATGDALVTEAEARLRALGEPVPTEPAPPLLRALAVELTCDLATVADQREAPAYVAREVEVTRQLALAYFAEAKAAGDDPDALDRLVAPAEARIQAAAAATPGAAFVLERVPARYAQLARDRAEPR